MKFVWLAFACLMWSALGCQYAPKMSKARWPWQKKELPAPDRLLAVWSDSVLHQPGLPGVRGFGGRVYFYQAQETDPIEVDGGVAVYVFDADEVEPTKQQPLRKYMFTAEQLKEHMSKTSLGPSYSLWLPWDEVGGEAKRLSLITRFEAVQGGTVISDPAIKLLPGIPASKEPKSPSDQPTTQLAQQSGSSSGGSGSTSDSVRAQMVVHQKTGQPLVTAEQIDPRGIQTIDLPPSFQQHLQRNKSSAPSTDSPTHPSLNSIPTTLGTDASGSVAPFVGSTTTVIDSRTIKGYQPYNSKFQPVTDRDRDIRQGQWIEPPRPRQPAVGAPSSNKTGSGDPGGQ